MSCALPTAHPCGEGRGFQQRARALFLRLLRCCSSAGGQEGQRSPGEPRLSRTLLPRLDGPRAPGHLRRTFALDFGTELLLSRRMIYSACGLACSLFKISCRLGKCGKGISEIPGWMWIFLSACLSPGTVQGLDSFCNPCPQWRMALEWSTGQLGGFTAWL